MDTTYGHMLPAAPCEISWRNYLDPLIMSSYYAEFGILVNVRGERFIDEGANEYTALTAPVCGLCHRTRGDVKLALAADNSLL
jgi:hypothetical protein